MSINSLTKAAAEFEKVSTKKKYKQNGQYKEKKLAFVKILREYIDDVIKKELNHDGMSGRMD